MRHIYLYLISGVIVFGLLLNACDSPNKASDTGNDLELNVPEGFNFQTTRAVNVDIRAYQLNVDRVIVEIYDANPTENGKRLQKLNVEGGKSFTTLMNLPTHLNYIWVEALGSDGYLGSYEVPVTGSNISVNLKGMPEQDPPMTLASLDCNSGCDAFVSGSTGMVTVNGQTICVAEMTSWNGTVRFEGLGGEFRVCGSGTFNGGNGLSFDTPDVAELYVTDTGDLNGVNFVPNYAGMVTTNHGFMTFTGNLLGQGHTFDNFGTAAFGGVNVRIAPNATLNNMAMAVFTSSTDFQHTGGTVNNAGLIEVADDYIMSNNNAVLENDCEIQVGGDFTMGSQAVATNNGYISVDGTTSIGSANTFNVGNFSYVDTGNLLLAGDIVGPTLGNYGRFDIALVTELQSGSNVLNRTDLCDADGIEIANGNIDASVTYCNAYIPALGCTPEVGSLPMDDEFPGDPFRIYNNPFPALDVYGTLLYEDLWPSFGDYDLNDLVVAYNINLITNLVNEVVDIEFHLVIRALGAAFDSGFGFEMPVDPSRVMSVNGARYTEGLITNNANGTEAGQSNAVVIMWDNSAYEMGKWVNTVSPANHVDEDSLTITLTFDPPVPIADLGPVPFKPFIFIENVRGREVHLPGNAPTDLVDTSLFGLEDDTTDPMAGRFYKSVTGLNWGINVPEEIPWPREKLNIMTAYLKYQAWAESGGVLDTDWYLDLPGHRNNTNMYYPPIPLQSPNPPTIPGPPTPGN